MACTCHKATLMFIGLELKRYGMYMYMEITIIKLLYFQKLIRDLHDRGESKTVQKGNVSASAWQDRKVVMAMATNCQPSAVGEVQRRKLDGSRVTIPCPQLVILYNRFMAGVDNSDQLRGYYECRKRSRKFYKYIYNFLFDVTITNCFILLKHFCRSVKMSLKEFRLKLASQLIGDYCSRYRPCRRPTAIRPLPLLHYPIKVNADNSVGEVVVFGASTKNTLGWTAAGTVVSVMYGDTAASYCGTHT